MSRPASVAPLLVAITLGSCKLARNEEQTSRDLPPPEPSAAHQPAKPTDLPAPTPRPRDTDRPAPRPAAEPTAKPTAPPAEPAPASEPTATAPAATATATATATGAAGGPPALNTNCLPKCQATLQGCVSKPPALDGGLPSLESLAECRKAFDDCRKECGL